MGIMQVIFLCLGAFPGLIQIIWGILAIVNAKITVYARKRVFGKPARWIGALLIVGALFGILTLQISLLVSLAASIVVGIFSLRSQKQSGFSRAIPTGQNLSAPHYASQWDQAMDEEDNEEWGTAPAFMVGENLQDEMPVQRSSFDQPDDLISPPVPLWESMEMPPAPGLNPLSSPPEQRLDHLPETPLPPKAADSSRSLPPRGLLQGGRETIPPTDSELAEIKRRKGEDGLLQAGNLVNDRGPIEKIPNAQPGQLPPTQKPVSMPPVRDPERISNQPPPSVRPVASEKISTGHPTPKPANPVGMAPLTAGSGVKAQPLAKLVVIRTSLQLQREFQVNGDRFDIGRGHGNDIQLLDETVSRRHAAIRHAQGMWFIQDPSSTSGTFINGSKVQAKRLEPGDEIMIGSTIFRFELNESR